MLGGKEPEYWKLNASVDSVRASIRQQEKSTMRNATSQRTFQTCLLPITVLMPVPPRPLTIPLKRFFLVQPRDDG
jgi:hypothetical protein